MRRGNPLSFRGSDDDLQVRFLMCQQKTFFCFLLPPHAARD